MKPIVGAVTVGQAPRVDVEADVLPILGDKVQLVQAGALDTVSDFAAIEPDPGDYVLVSRLRDGRSVRFAEGKILGNLQAAIDSLEAQGASAIMVWCTGEFPESIHANVPLVYPCRLISGVVGALDLKHIAAIVPDESQVAQMDARWAGLAERATILAASPYGPQEARDAAARTLRDTDAELVVLDCIGFTSEMKERVAELSGKPVMLPRTLLARTMLEII